MVTRRDFLAQSAALVSLAPFAPPLLRQASAAAAEVSGERVLVVIQLSGGNDGLNTVIPFKDAEYRKNRFTLAIPAEQQRKINDELAFHPSLGGFAKLLEAGKLAIVQGVGYPQPNRSHFESMDLWHTAHQLNGSRPAGWLGKYLDGQFAADGRDVPALHLGGEKQPLALAGEKAAATSVQSLERFRVEPNDAAFVAEIRRATTAARDGGNELLSFIQSSASAALAASGRVERSLGKYKTDIVYPGTGLAQKLRMIAQLIDAGLSTRIYYVTLDGFDTHANQAAAHAGLLSEVGDATRAFVEDLDAHGHGKRVAVLTFSEFGRRVRENASAGTDHGAAAPLFVAGGGIRSGVIGKHPSLTDLDDGDLKQHTDYRRVYAALLENWLRVKSAPILGGDYEPLPLI